MKKSWLIRGTSALLAVITTVSTVSESALAAQYIEPVATVATTSDGTSTGTKGGTTGTSASSSGGETNYSVGSGDITDDNINDMVAEYMLQQFGVEGKVLDDDEVADMDDADTDDTDSDDADKEPDKVVIDDVDVDDDGAVTVTDNKGNRVKVSEDGENIEQLEVAENDEAFVYNVDDANAVEGYDYLGTGEESGMALYRAQIDLRDVEEISDQEIQDAEARELQEQEDFLRWYNQEELTSDEIAVIMQEAAEWDQEVLENCYEPVYGETTSETVDNDEYNAPNETDTETVDEDTDEASDEEPEIPAEAEEITEDKDKTEKSDEQKSDEQKSDQAEPDRNKENQNNKNKDDEESEEVLEENTDADIEETTEDEAALEAVADKESDEEENVEETGTEIIGYRLRDEYDNEIIESDLIEIGSSEAYADAEAAAEDGVMLLDGAGDANDTPVWQGTTILIVDDSTLVIRVIDATTGKGLNGASITIQIDKNDPVTLQTATIGSEKGAGLATLTLNSTENQSAFVNVTRPGYRGITRTRETVTGGTVLTYALYPAQIGETYLRGATLDGIDVYETNYELFVSHDNDSEYDIIAYVERVSYSPSALPDELSILSNNVDKTDWGTRTVKRFVQDPDYGYGYAMYTFHGKWSHYDSYDEDDQCFLPGKEIALRFDNAQHPIVWANPGATESGKKMPLKITVSLPATENAGARNANFGFTPKDGFYVKIPKKFPGLGGGKLSFDSIAVLPVVVDVQLNGTLMIGVSFSKDLTPYAEALLKGEKLSSVKPADQEKHNSLVDEIVDKFQKKCKAFKKQNEMRETAHKTKDKFREKYFPFYKEFEVTASVTVVGIFTWNRRSGYYTGNFEIILQLTADFTITFYYALLPVYVGFEVELTGKLEFVGGVKYKSVDDLLSWEDVHWTDNSGIAVLFSIMVSPFAGLGWKGVGGIEFGGEGELDFLFNLYSATQLPGCHFPRVRIYVSWEFYLKAYMFIAKYKKTLKSWEKCMLDTWDVDDYSGNRNGLPSDISYMSVNTLVPDENGNRVIPAALLADNETREAVADASEQEYGLYVQENAEGSQEIVINKDSTQTTVKEFEDIEETTEAGVEERQSLGEISVSQKMTYVSGDTKGLYLRIANVKDNESYGGAIVPRVTVMTADSNGLSGKAVALPATMSVSGASREYYGYDYNFGVYMVNDDYCYVAIASTSIDPQTATLEQLGENSRIRLVLLKGTEVVASKVLRKDSSDYTNYLFTGAPYVYGDASGGEGGLGQYMVAGAVTTDLNAVTASLAQDITGGDMTDAPDDTSYESEAKLPINDAIYIDTNMAALGSSASESVQVYSTNGKFISGLQIILPEMVNAASNMITPLIAYVERGSLSTLRLLSVWNNWTGMNVKKENPITLSGDICNMQYPNDRIGSTLYCTVDGALQSLQFRQTIYASTSYLFGTGELSYALATYPTRTDTGEQVVLPTSDGLQLVEAEGSLFIITCSNKRGDQKSNGSYERDSVITVYTAYQQGGKYQIGGPRETRLKDRTVFSAVCAATRKTGTGSESGYVLRMLYLADEKANIVSDPSGQLEASKYYLGVTDDICNLYMWELHTGRGAQINELTTDSYVVRKSDGKVTMIADVQNTGAHAASTVTIAVTTDPTGQADRKDYVYDFSSTIGALGPGSIDTISFDVDLLENWNGETNLYAAVVQVNGQDMSKGYEAKWVENGSLLDNGDFYLDVWEDGIGAQPYAALRIDNYSSRPFTDIAVNIEVNRYSKGEEDWESEARCKVSDYIDDTTTTGYLSRTAALHIPISKWWDDPDVYAIRFTLVSDAWDLTLNNAYKISEMLERPHYDVDRFLFRADAEDPSMGDVALIAADESLELTDDDGYEEVEKGTQLTFKATAADGYVLDHWEFYDFGSAPGWVNLDGENRTATQFSLKAGDYINVIVDGTEQRYQIGGPNEDTVLAQAVFKPDGTTRALITTARATTTVDESGEATTTYEPSILNTLLNITWEEQYNDKIHAAETPVTGVGAYRLADSAVLKAGLDYDPDLYVFDGWYTFTYDEDVVSVREKWTGEVQTDNTTTIKQSGETPEVCLIAVFRENESPTPNLYLDTQGGTLTDRGAATYNGKLDKWIKVDEITALPTADDLEREGYTFDGWVRYVGGKEEKVTDLSAMTDENNHLFAQWTAVNPKVGLLVYAKDENGTVEIQDSQDKGYKELEKGAKATVIATPIEGATFDHWEMCTFETEKFVPVEGAGATYTLTVNQHTCLMAYFNGPASVDADVEIDWDVEEGATKPDSVQIQLMDSEGNKVGGVVTLTERNGWTYTWEGLDSGKIYEIEFLNLRENDHASYTGSAEDGFTIHYTCCPDPEPEHHIDIPVTVDQSGLADGATELDKVEVRLKATTEAGEEVTVGDYTLTAAENWQHTFENLLDDLTYKVVALNLPTGYAYTVEGSQTAETGFTIKITGGSQPTPPTPETITASVAIDWQLASETTAKPTPVVVRLYDAEGNQVKELSLTEDVDWKGQFDDLTKGEDYTLKVLNVPTGYQAEVTGDAQEGWTIRYTGGSTPEPEPATIDAPVRILWNLDSGADRPDEVQVSITEKDAASPLQTVTLQAEGKWKGTFTGLDKDTGYEVKVVDLDQSYVVASITGDPSIGYDITITGGPRPAQTIDVDVDVAWKFLDQTSQRPDSIKVQIYRNGNPADEIVELGSNNGWHYTWTGLDAEDTYTVVVLDVPETDEATVTGNQLQGFTVNYTCGTHPEELVDASVQIDWRLNAGAPRPEEIQVRIKDESGWPASDDLTLTASEKESLNWKGTFTGLVRNQNYQVYALNMPDGYEYTVSGDVETGYTITITGGDPEEPVPETIQTTVSVAWQLNGADRPDSVTVVLSEGSENAVVRGFQRIMRTLNVLQDQDAVLGEDNGWSAVYTGLTKSKNYGLTVKSIVPGGYTATVSGNVAEGYVVTIYGQRTPEPVNPDNPGSGNSGSGSRYTSSEGSAAGGNSTYVKVDWDLNEGAERPHYIKVRLSKEDGTWVGDYVTTLNELGNWQHVWEPLNIGELYHLEVLDYSGIYKIVVTGDASHGFTLTVTGGQVADADEKPVDADGNPIDTSTETTGQDGESADTGNGEESGEGHVSATGDDSQMMLWLFMMLVSGTVLAAWIRWRRREE